MKKVLIFLMIISSVLILCACPVKTSDRSSAQFSSTNGDDLKEETPPVEAEKENTSGTASSKSESVAAKESKTRIYHGFKQDGEDMYGVFIHITLRDNGTESFTMSEYMYIPSNTMFNMYGVDPAENSGTHYQFPRIDMRNIQFDADGRASLTEEGTIEININGDSLSYRSYGSGFDFTYECSLITDGEYLSLMNW